MGPHFGTTRLPPSPQSLGFLNLLISSSGSLPGMMYVGKCRLHDSKSSSAASASASTMSSWISAPFSSRAPSGTPQRIVLRGPGSTSAWQALYCFSTVRLITAR